MIETLIILWAIEIVLTTIGVVGGKT